MIALDTLPAAARLAFEGLQSENARLQSEHLRLQRIVELKDEQIRLLNFRMFGPKSDQLSPAQKQLLLAEGSWGEGEGEREAGLPAAQKAAPKVKIPRPSHPGREPLPAHLERRGGILASPAAE